jgi:integrase/recombinase XerD
MLHPALFTERSSILLEQGVPLEDVQRLAGHADPRTTRLYDRRQKKITRNIVERISI